MMMTMMMIMEGYGCFLFVSSSFKIEKDKIRLGPVGFFYHSMQCLYSVDEKMFKLSNLRRKTKRTLYRVKLENSINI